MTLKKMILAANIPAALSLSGCYTSFRVIHHYPAYDHAAIEDVYYEPAVLTLHQYHRYHRPYYQRIFFHYDPYDFWYDDAFLQIYLAK